MFRARHHILEHDLATIPQGESLSVVATPQYLRNSLPFAAYFEAPPFDEHPAGIYVVTPSVDGSGGAMREHNRSSIINTSIHEAYPGHHLQLSAATTHPSLARLMLDAPEFVEGWGMYSEQMMREEGFEAAPACMFALYTDAIWRACRIVLDVRLHRGELTVAEAADFLVEHTGFERPHAVAEVKRYTLTPTQPLSYLLGKVMLLRLRDDERRRLGSDFSLKRFHDALLYGGQHPHLVPPPPAGRRGRRAGRAAADARSRAGPGLMQVIPSLDVQAGRSRLVYWPGAATGEGRPDRPTRADRPPLRGARRSAHPPGRPGRGASRAAGQHGGHPGGRPDRGDAAPGGGRHRRPGADRACLRRGRDACRHAAAGRGRGTGAAGAPASPSPATGWPWGWTRGPTGCASTPGAAVVAPTLGDLVARLTDAGRPPLRALPRAAARRTWT